MACKRCTYRMLILYACYNGGGVAGYVLSESGPMDVARLVSQRFYLRPPRLLVRCVYSVPVIFGVPMNLSPAAASMQALMASLVAKCSRFERQRSGETATVSCQRVGIVSFVLLLCALVSIYCEAFADVIGLFGACFGTLICLIWPLRTRFSIGLRLRFCTRIYLKVMKTLHSKALSTMISAALFFAASMGMAAFAEQPRAKWLPRLNGRGSIGCRLWPGALANRPRSLSARGRQSVTQKAASRWP